jgi:hypothetical protein
MAKFRVPKGLKLDKETLKILESKQFVARVKARREPTRESELGSGFYPDGDVVCHPVSFSVKPQTSKKKGKTPRIYADDWLVRFIINDPSHKHNGKQFTHRYRQFIDDGKKRTEEEGPKFSYGAGEMKQLLAAGLIETDPKKIKRILGNEENWPKILAEMCVNEIDVAARCWTTEDVSDKDGKTYSNNHMRVRGPADEDDGEEEEAPDNLEEEEEVEEEVDEEEDHKEDDEETDSDSESGEGEIEDEMGGDREEEPEESEEDEEDDSEDTEEEEEAEDTEDEEESEEDEEEAQESELTAGDKVIVKSKKYGKIKVVVKSVATDGESFKGVFKKKGAKKGTIVTFPYEEIHAYDE